VLLHVTGFQHYLYVAAPTGFTQHDCQPFKSFLETAVAQHAPAIAQVQLAMRENMYGFQGNQKSPYIKVTVTDPKYINRLRSAIEQGNANYKGLWKNPDDGILTFDNIQYKLRFMTDCKVGTSPNPHSLHPLILYRSLACHGSKLQLRNFK
jgi:DNA polymerase delta subunit 1